MEESGLFLDLLVNCICVMHFIINRETFYSEKKKKKKKKKRGFLVRKEEIK